MPLVARGHGRDMVDEQLPLPIGFNIGPGEADGSRREWASFRFAQVYYSSARPSFVSTSRTVHPLAAPVAQPMLASGFFVHHERI